jgi:hypothetical protein
MVDTTASLSYMVKLAAAGMCDGLPGSVGLAERLRKLECSREAWTSSVWSQPEDFPYSKRCSPSPVALSGNLAVFAGPEFCSGEYLFLRFRSEARGIPERVWHLDLDCENIVDAICLDDSQDLFVFSRLVANVQSLFLTWLMDCLLS